MPNGISIIGSTGSIGKSALRVAHRLNLNISCLVAHSNLELLKQQADTYKPTYVGVIDESKYKQAKSLFSNYKLICGKQALTQPAELDCTDTVLISVVGHSGIFPLINAIKHNKKIALANKESLVCGGSIVYKLLADSKAQIIPVDSEHNAVFQCLKGETDNLKRVILTASGGAFYKKTSAQLKQITAKDIFHPNWQMGRKITIDSSTMVNKALEIIEAAWLFDTNDIDYVVHTDSLIHSMVELKDGIILAQLSPCSMEYPIQHALTFPHRIASINPQITPIDFTKPLSFIKKRKLFNAPEIAQAIIKKDKRLGVTFNAANDAALELFENGAIGFLDIVRIVENCVNLADTSKLDTIDDIIETHNSLLHKVRLDYKQLTK